MTIPAYGNVRYQEVRRDVRLCRAVATIAATDICIVRCVRENRVWEERLSELYWIDMPRNVTAGLRNGMTVHASTALEQVLGNI